MLLLEVGHEWETELVTGFGARGGRAASVAKGAAQRLESHVADGAPVGEHLADPLVIPHALANGGSFDTGQLTTRFPTNLLAVKSCGDACPRVAVLPRGRWPVGLR